MKMIEQLKQYQSQLESLSASLEDRYPEGEAAQERMDERLGLLEECIEAFDELIESVECYQKTYRGLGKIK